MTVLFSSNALPSVTHNAGMKTDPGMPGFQGPTDADPGLFGDVLYAVLVRSALGMLHY
jgi:hypothetical protein